MNKKGIVLSELLFTLLCYILLIEGYYWTLISSVFVPMSVRYPIYLGLALLVFIVVRKLKFKKRDRTIILSMVLYSTIILFRNQEMAHGSYSETSRLMVCMSVMLLSFAFTDWYRFFPKAIVVIGLPNVIATLLFYLNNGLYQIFIRKTYGYYQSGTALGVNGYKAALADNYSQNGTYITIVLLALGALTLVGRNVKNAKVDKRLFLIMIFSIAALLLTTKRAHILFSAATLIVTYYVINYKNKSGRTFNLLLVLSAIFIAFAVTIEYVPALGVFMERFRGVNVEDVGLATRVTMWERAFLEFKTHPIFGIGWYGFRYVGGLSGNALTASSSGVHNSYIELLCDSGIVGFILFVFFAGKSITSTIRNYKCTEQIEDRRCLVVSFAIQFFVLLYGISGNAFFDKTFNFYVIAVAINTSYLIKQQKLKNESCI